MTATATLPTPSLPRAGTQVTVTMPDGYKTQGRLIGLTSEDGIPRIRVLAADRLERRIPIQGAVVAADVA